jgi:molybdate transport system substrate-binding protein
MRTTHGVCTAVFGLFMVACAGMHTAPTTEARQALAPSGTLRIGVYVDSPISLLRDSATGEAKGVAHDSGKEVARRLGVASEVVEFPRVAEVLEALKAGRVDITVTNATAARAKDVDFTSPLLLLELGYLLPAGSPVTSLADIDRPGMRIGVTQGSTSQSTLPRRLKSATVVPAPSIKGAIEMLSQHQVDAFATNKANLFQISDSLPGSRVLDGQWGVEHLAIAIPKGRDQGMAWLQTFVAQAKAEGFVTRAVEKAGLRGTAKAEVRVMISGGFSAAYRNLSPEFERATRNVVVTIRGPSMGETPEAIPNRLRRGEPVDVLIMVDTELDELIKQGKVVAGSRVDLARSNIGAAVRSGAPKPDISSLGALKRTLIEAKSIAYSDSASGVYLATVVFQRLGIADQVKSKSRMIPAEPVGAVVARGEAEIGFQTVSALIPVPGIDVVGVLPPEIQKATVFSAGVAVGAKEPDAARALIRFLTSPGAAPEIAKTGMEPLTSR